MFSLTMDFCWPLLLLLLWVDFVEIVWVTILATQAAGGGDLYGGGNAHDVCAFVDERTPIAMTVAMTNVTYTNMDPHCTSG